MYVPPQRHHTVGEDIGTVCPLDEKIEGWKRKIKKDEENIYKG